MDSYQVKWKSSKIRRKMFKRLDATAIKSWEKEEKASGSYSKKKRDLFPQRKVLAVAKEYVL